MESGTLIVVEAILGNLETRAGASGDGRTVERVRIESDDLAKRVLRLASSAGDIGLRLSGSTPLRDGDIVYEDASRIVALDVAPETLLAIAPASIAQALDIAHALGNRHLPVQIDGETLLVRDDRLVETLLRERDVPYARVERKLATPFRHAHAPHGH